MNPTLEAALHLAALDLKIIPLCRRAKIPARKGWRDHATADAPVLRNLFAREGLNLGVATGAPSGVWVLDLDVKDGARGLETLAALEARHGGIEGAWRSRTPSGGYHLWFSCSEGWRIGCRVGVLPGLDVRGDGGFIVAPPSRLATGAYSWIASPPCVLPATAPAWLLNLVAPPPPPCISRVIISAWAGSERLRRYAAVALERELERVERAGPGARNAALFQASCALGSLAGAGLLSLELAEGALILAGEVCGLVADDGRRSVEATVVSGLRRGFASPRAVTL